MNIFRFFPVYEHTQDWHYSHVWTNSSVNRAVLPVPTVTWATRHFISLISIRKKYESNFKEISKLHLLVVNYECTSGQRKHSDSWGLRRSLPGRS